MNAPVPAPDDVPAELRERAQWLMWDASADAPRRPHWRGNFGVSWTDPDDWHSFNEAREAAEERGSWGIGYVFAKSNDDEPRGIYGALDLDGCVELRENGTARPKDWLPSLQPFFDRDAYLEFSPSDEGVHIPVAGFEPPEWWSDAHFTDDEHEGVEAYGAKFFTVTGNRLRGSGDTVVDAGEWLEGWLIQAYKAITGESPTEPVDSSESNTDRGRARNTDHTEWLDEDDVRDALEAIDPDIGRNTWRDIGFALANEFPRGTARSLFVDWSRKGNKWDSEAERQAKQIIEDGSDWNYSLGTVVYHAKEAGWTLPNRSTATANGDGEADEDGLPEPTEFELRRGGYGYTKEKKNHKGDVIGEEWVQWTNFQLEAVEFLRLAEADDDLRITIRVHPNTSEDSYEVTVPTTTFNDARSFRDRVVIGLSTTFEAGPKVLNKLRRFVAAQDAPFRVGVEQVGLYGLGSDERTEWVTPNGAITADGWTDDPEHAFDGRDTPVSRGWSLDQEDGSEVDPEAVRDALRLIPQTRVSDRFLPVLGWFYAAPLRPYIMRWEGEFNQLNITGDTGSGKTATIGVLNQLFGGDREPLSATATSFSVMSSFAASNAMPVVFDEYKPSDMADYEVNRFHEYYRKSSRGAVETRGNRDMSVDSYPLRAPVAVAGEQAINGPAEERRSIATAFSTRAIAKHSSTRKAFAELAGLSYEHASGEVEHFDGVDPRHHALAYYRFVTGLDEGELRDAWRKSEHRVRDCLAQMGGDVADGVRDAEFRALQTVAFGIGTFRAFADEYGVDVTKAPTNLINKVVDDALRYLVTGNNGPTRGRRSTHLDRLLGLMARAAYAESLEEGTHYTFVDEGEPDELLAIKLAPAFDRTRRYARDHDVRGEDLLDSASDYRGRLADAAEQDDSVVVDTSRQVWGLNRSVVIHVGRAMEAINGFDRDMFRPEKANKHVGVGVSPDTLTEAHADADGGSSAEPPQKDRVEIISEALRTLAEQTSGGALRTEIVSHVEKRHGIEPSTTRDHLDQFVRDGLAIETDENRLVPNR